MRNLQYSIDDVPPIHISILLGFQQFLTMMGGTIAMPVIIAEASCVGPDLLGRAQIMSTLMFVNGLATLLQVYFGVRLPIIQGPSFSFVVPMLAMQNFAGRQCPDPEDYSSWRVFPGSSQHRQIWMSRLAEIQGAMLLAGALEAIIGSLGLVSLIFRFVGPLTIAPTMALIALTLVGDIIENYASTFWPLAILAMCLVLLCTLYLRSISLPIPAFSVTTLVKERRFLWKFHRLRIFALFPIIIAIGISWGVYAIIALADALPDNLKVPNGNSTRGMPDVYLSQMSAAPWFHIPYPGQWGLPRLNLALTIGMFAAIISSIVESIGDYCVCARMCGVSLPPSHAINRGITVEGIGCMLAGAFGSGPGVTSYSENVGAIGITGVASRRVFFVTAIFLIFFGCFTKVAMFFVLIPEPIIGGILIAILALCAAVGFSYLQYIDMKSTRNLLIFGLSIFLGLGIPNWIRAHPGIINSGSEFFDEIVTVLLSTGIFVGGFIGFFLDNTVPKDGDDKDIASEIFSSDSGSMLDETYDFPFNLGTYVRKVAFFHYVPICPPFEHGKLTKWFREFRRRHESPEVTRDHGEHSDSGNGSGVVEIRQAANAMTTPRMSDVDSGAAVNEAYEGSYSGTRPNSQMSLTLSFSGCSYSATPRLNPLPSSTDDKWTEL